MNIVILCGGSGTRLWPLSRKKLPKQFLKLTNNNTMFQNTILRFKQLEVASRLHFTVICNKEHDFIVKQQIEEIQKEFEFTFRIVTEPIGRDTAAAVCIASLVSSPEEISVVVPCDHIFNDHNFCELVKIAEEYYISKGNSIVTFGIKPTYPETGYGYIRTGPGNSTEKFTEKPNKECAEEYIAQGNYLWNAGVFMFRNSTMISAFEKYSGDILSVCRDTLTNSEENNGVYNLDKSTFETCKAISIDYEIMEQVTGDNEQEISAYTLEYSSKWSDIGSFKVLSEECDHDENGNNLKGNVVMCDTQNCYIESEKSVVATIGLKDLVIVNNRDALLISHKDHTQDVKKVLAKIEDKDLKEVHATAYRPWGWYTNVEGNDYSGFKVKRICVYPKKRLSLQSHNHRSEHWVIVKGQARVQLDDKFIEMGVSDHVYIPVKALHRMENIGDTMVEFVETQIGDYLGEDDIVRYEDDFGRK
jgi:mannose-1-phosphate guanylyltransferase/mannose-6-phosphate isomerase